MCRSCWWISVVLFYFVFVYGFRQDYDELMGIIERYVTKSSISSQLVCESDSFLAINSLSPAERKVRPIYENEDRKFGGGLDFNINHSLYKAVRGGGFQPHLLRDAKTLLFLLIDFFKALPSSKRKNTEQLHPRPPQCITRCQKIYNVIAKIKKNRMQGRNTIEEVLCLSAQRGYTLFYRNYEDSNATTYRWVLQYNKHLYFSNTTSTENEQDVNAHGQRVGGNPYVLLAPLLETLIALFWEVGKFSLAGISHPSILYNLRQKGIESEQRSPKNLHSKFPTKALLRGRPPRAPRGKGGRGCSPGRSSLSSVIDPTPCSTCPYTDAFPTFIYPLIENWNNVIGDGNCGYRVVTDFVFGDEHQWPELEMHDGYPIPPLHVQWIHHHSDRVSNWADAYYDRIADL
ncbi:hypothetical protein M9H77_17552 [Catharanthus roseus]|uniref:Uncharacterized protein n=1 Tax=Catharanthus roseus TaxID=4058 RepID=A0ACC0B4X6_CATRO|nr:hypothetical protein M9H77_17552 [Catharanthus roseus]